MDDLGPRPYHRSAGSGSSDEGNDDVGGVPVEVLASAVVDVVVRGSARRAASGTSRSGTPASSAAMMNEYLIKPNPIR